MNDQDLRRALRDLPREGASDGFTRRTLARLDDAPASEPVGRLLSSWTLGRAAAAAALLLAVATAVTLVPVLDRRATRHERPAVAADGGPTAEAAEAAEAARAAERSRPGTATGADRLAALRELRAERDRLATEIEDFKRELHGGSPGGVPTDRRADLRDPAGDPMLYLGGDDRVDLVLDLGRLATDRGRGSS